MPVTMQQVAEVAGVARATVSLVLSGKARQAGISARCEQQVLEAARRLNFRPNSAAKAIRNNRFGTVALLLSTDGTKSNLPAPLRTGVLRALVERDLHLSIAELPDEKLTSDGYIPRILRELSADGLLVNYTDGIPASMVRLIERHALPAVWLNTKRQADCVHPDDLDAGALAAEYVLRAGRRRIAYVDYPHGWQLLPTAHYSAADREAGVRRVIETAGLSLRLIRELTTPCAADRARHIVRWLRESGRPDAVIAYGNEDAVDVCYHAAAAGIRVPDDLLVVTFGDQPYWVGGMPIPTVLVPQLQVGRQAVEMLAAKIAEPARLQPAVAVKASILLAPDPDTWPTLTDNVTNPPNG